MDLKDILVHIDNRPTCPGRLEAAIFLARRHKAKLTGLFVETHSFFIGRSHTTEEQRAEARELFLTETAKAGVESEWICIDSASTGLGVSEAVNLHAYYRDLVVLSQTDPEDGDRSIPADLPTRAVLGSGRPVLLIPYAGRYPSLGDRILLAWRGGPESARATAESLPLLRHAKAVKVLSVQSAPDEGPHFVGGDICTHLALHGVEASCETAPTVGLSVGDILLNRAAEEGSDLLVMGAFSQLRRGVPALGEVGRYLLRYMTVPVIMSH